MRELEKKDVSVQTEKQNLTDCSLWPLLMKTQRLLFPSNLQLIDLMSADDAGSDASIMSEAVINKTYAHFLFYKHTQTHYIATWKNKDVTERDVES